MASISISCPAAGDHVKVTAGSGSGAQGTICVQGTFAESIFWRLLKFIFAPLVRLFRWLFPKKAMQRTRSTGLTVRVRVVSGIATPLPDLTMGAAGDTDVSPTPNWCARSVPVPSWSSSGVQLTVIASLLSGVGSGSVTLVDGPHGVNFFGGGSPPVDCCSGCGFGSGQTLLAGELASQARLEVAVPDGPNAGLHTATAVSYLRWALTIRGVEYEVAWDRGVTLELRGPSASFPSRSVEGGPFSATFPGAVFGSVSDVVVTIA